MPPARKPDSSTEQPRGVAGDGGSGAAPRVLPTTRRRCCVAVLAFHPGRRGDGGLSLSVSTAPPPPPPPPPPREGDGGASRLVGEVGAAWAALEAVERLLLLLLLLADLRGGAA